MKAILVLDSTPSAKGSYSFQGAGIAICSPCCANTFYTEEVIAEREPLTAGPFECPACHKQFCVTHGEIVLVGLSTNSKVEVTADTVKVVKPDKATREKE